MTAPWHITYEDQPCNQKLVTKVDTCPHFILIDICRLAVMCSNSWWRMSFI